MGLPTKQGLHGMSIRTRLSFIFSLIVGLICLFIFLYFPAQIEKHAMVSVAAKAQSIGGMMAYSLAPLFYFGDQAAMEPVIRSARQNPDFLYAVVFTGGGDLSVAWNEDLARASGFKEAETGRGVTPDGKIYRASASITRNGFEVGRLYFGLSLAGMREQVIQSRRASAVVSLAVFLVGILAVLWASAVITRPLNRVVLTARQITAGDLRQRTDVASGDEVGQLARAFNGMVDHLAEAQDDLAKLNQNLEDRVEERTAELQREIGVRKRAEEQLVHDALHDSLTSLPNRALFGDRLAQVFKRSRRHTDYGFAVFLLGLDGFKLVNDSYGHSTGDDLLRAVGNRLREQLRFDGTVARLGGDQYAVLVDDLKCDEDARKVAGRIYQALSLPWPIGGHEVYTTASIGISAGPGQYGAPEEILRDADTAMHKAKIQGRGGLAIFSEGMHSKAVLQLEMETALRKALVAGEFRVHYQPIVEVGSGAIRGVEALIRWEHPERGRIPPGEFIPLAEETGLVMAMDRWVLGEACRQVRVWQTQFPSMSSLSVSVNLSGMHFARPEVLQEIRGVLAESGLEGRYLKLEITERVILDNADSLQSLLVSLREMGIQLSIDDFGTGYSSLSYLHRFPVDVLKVDRSFVEGIGGTGHRWEIVRTIVSLAHSLGLEVIAEGVETGEQRAFLNALRCQLAQGYLFSPPLDAVSMEALIQNSRPDGVLGS